MTDQGPEHIGPRPLAGYVMRDYDDLIARLTESRKAQGMSQAALAAAAHYRGHASISLVETGRIDAGGRRLFDLAYALGYDLALIPRKDTP